MTVFTDPHISIAVREDIPAIVELLNKSYRGDSSRKGWTTEADLIAGNVRTNEADLAAVMQTPGSVILTYKADGQLLACVNLKKQEGKLYLGMFSVDPELQGGGLGKKMLQAAEEHALQQRCSHIFMYVITHRTELIDWYKRKGYADTGKRIPFEEDGLTGKHLKELEFMVLEKPIPASA